MRARLAVTYVQVEGIVGLEHILLQLREDSLPSHGYSSRVMPRARPMDAGALRGLSLEYFRKETDTDKIAAFHRQMSHRCCLLAHEIALAQACALQLNYYS